MTEVLRVLTDAQGGPAQREHISLNNGHMERQGNKCIACVDT